MKIRRLLTIASLTAGVSFACTPDPIGTTGPPQPGDVPPVTPGITPDPATFGIVCEAEFIVTGQVTNPQPVPEDVTGCWASGTWDLQIQVVSNECGSDLPAATSFKYQVTIDEDSNTTYSYLDDPTSDLVALSVTSGGAGDCQGSFEHFTADRKGTTVLRPSLYPEGRLDGKGTFQLFNAAQNIDDDD